MFAISIELLARRYHATPWGAAANEGRVEWPPSPWRIGRALVDAWYRAPADERPSPDAVDGLLGAMAAPPHIHLPRATVGQSAHYMPKPLEAKTTLVFDAFVRTDGGLITLAWPEWEPAAEQRAAAAYLVDRLAYLGRAESVARWRVVAGPPPGSVAAAVPAEVAAVAGDHDGWEHLRLLCLDPSATIEALSVSTTQLRAARQPGAPAGRHIAYVRRPGLLDPAVLPPLRRGGGPSGGPVEVLRFALDGPVRPPLGEAVQVGDLFRRAALRRMADRHPDDPDLLAQLRGRRSDDGAPEQGHRHAHYLATDEDGDGRLDHLTVWCPAGLLSGAVEALDMTFLRGYPLRRDLGVVRLAEVGTLREEAGKKKPPFPKEAGPLCGISRVWRSVTPFVPTRHPKRRNGHTKYAYPDQVATELERRGLPEPVEVVPYRGHRHWGGFALGSRHEDRGRVDRDPWPPALGFELRFAEPVVGPIALGGQSHRGLGLFMPVAQRE